MTTNSIHLKKDIDIPAPPSRLSREAQAVWTAIVEGYVLGASDFLLLEGVLASWDAYTLACQAVEEHGLVTKMGGMLHANPACKLANDALREFRLGLKQLDLADPSDNPTLTLGGLPLTRKGMPYAG